MINLQVKNIPEDLHRKLRLLAKRGGISLRTLVLETLVKRVEMEEFQEHLTTRRSVRLDQPAGVSLDEVRSERDVEVGG